MGNYERIGLNYRSFKDQIEQKQRGQFFGITNNSNLWSLYLYLGERNDSERIIYKLFDTKVGTDREINCLLLQNFLETQTESEFFVYDLKVDLPAVINHQNDILNNNFIVQILEALKIVNNTCDLGDIISFDRESYSHHAILTDKERMIVTHRTGSSNISSPINGSVSTNESENKGIVTEDFLIDVIDLSKVKNGNEYYSHLGEPKHVESILKFAKDQLGIEGYSLTDNNCHHFVSECRYGKKYSPGVVVNATTAILGVGAVAAVGGCLAYSAFSSGQENSENRNESNDDEN